MSSQYLVYSSLTDCLAMKAVSGRVHEQTYFRSCLKGWIYYMVGREQNVTALCQAICEVRTPVGYSRSSNILNGW